MNKGRVGEDRGGKETDRCPLTFIAKFTHELYQLLGIKLAMSMAYYLQTDINQELKGYL
jgi:hypothetical protein